MTARSLLCLIVGLTSSASAIGQALPRWKFEKGQVFDVERVTTQKQMLEVKGKQLNHERKTTWVLRVEVKEVKGDTGSLLATLTKIEHELPNASAQELGDAKLAEKMQGASIALTVTTTGRLVDCKGYDDLLMRIAENDKTKLGTLKMMIPETGVKEAFADIFGPLPEKEMTWKREYVEPVPHLGALRSTATYEHVGVKNSLDLINYKIETKYEAPQGDMAVLFRVVKGSIDSEKGRGLIAFDANAGRLAFHERSMTLRGKLTIEANDRQAPLEFTSENEVKIWVKAGKK